MASRDAERAKALAASHPRAVVAPTFEEAVRGSDGVCCCTNAPEPVLDLSWLAPGAHVSSVGSGGELDAAIVAAASLFVEWRGAATNLPPAGAAELQGCDPKALTEVGEVLSGRRPGRTRSDEITVFKSTGHAVEDIVAAALVYGKATAGNVGTVVAL